MSNDKKNNKKSIDEKKSTSMVNKQGAQNRKSTNTLKINKTNASDKAENNNINVKNKDNKEEQIKNFPENALKKIFNITSLIIKSIFVFLFIINLVFLLKMNLLPTKYLLTFILISSIVLILDILTEFILKNKIMKIISLILSFIFILLYIFIYIYISKTDNFIDNLFGKHQIETYYLAVLDESEYSNIDDLNNLKIGTYYNNEESYNEIIKNINKSIKYNEVKYNNLFALCDNLVTGNVDAILINEANKNIIEELNEFEHVKLKYIYEFTIKTKVNNISKSIDVTKEPFIVYISGIDTSDSIFNVSRSDVNIIVVVNPKTKDILLVTIPRDYYVQLHGTTGTKDILTHAGLYGIDMSVTTIEDLLDIDINYYIRLNFSTLVKAIDVIGGIEVYSEYDFNTYGYQFYQGYNYLNGEYALAFARARKNFYTGDRQRGKNQLLVIEAIINKFSTSTTLLNNYLEILESLNGTFQTNIESSRIYSLIKMQLSDMKKWNIERYSLDGISSQNYTYSLGDIIAFVMEPDYNTVNEAKEKINNLLKKD